jgi:hypothetical protein
VIGNSIERSSIVSLRFMPRNTTVSSGSSCLLDLLGCFGGPLQFRQARLNVFNLDRLGSVAQDTIRSPKTARRRRTRVDHDFQQRGRGGAGGLPQPRDRLTMGDSD